MPHTFLSRAHSIKQIQRLNRKGDLLWHKHHGCSRPCSQTRQFCSPRLNALQYHPNDTPSVGISFPHRQRRSFPLPRLRPPFHPRRHTAAWPGEACCVPQEFAPRQRGAAGANADHQIKEETRMRVSSFDYTFRSAFAAGRSFWQYWVHSLSVQLEQRSVSLLLNQKRSGCKSTLSSQTTHTTAAISSRL